MEVAQFNSVQIQKISLNKLHYICDALEIKSQVFQVYHNIPSIPQ